MILESVDGRHADMTEGKALDWQWPCVEKWVSQCVCVIVYACLCVSGSVCGIILQNLSL